MKHSFESSHENVALRQIRETDLELLRRWRNESENSKYLRKIPHITVKMQKEWYESYLENHDEMTFAIVETQDLCGSPAKRGDK